MGRMNKLTLLGGTIWGFGGLERGVGSARLANGGNSLGYMTPANVIACLAQAKALSKPQPNRIHW